MKNIELMGAEHAAWLEWSNEVQRLTGRHINDGECNLLVALTRSWGEKLALLRSGSCTKHLQAAIAATIQQKERHDSVIAEEAFRLSE